MDAGTVIVPVAGAGAVAATVAALGAFSSATFMMDVSVCRQDKKRGDPT
jgi:hypothetical protein